MNQSRKIVSAIKPKKRLNFDQISNFFLAFGKNILFFIRHSSIHGLRHTAESRNFAWRIFWIIVLLLSGGCLYVVLLPEVQRSADISFTPNTHYIHWSTTFPGVTICEIYNSKTSLRKLNQEFPRVMESLSFDYKRHLTDLVYSRGACSQAVCVPCGGAVPCDLPWRTVVNAVRKTCSEMITDCSFNGVKFSCCSSFNMVDSETGPCYAFNTLQNKHSSQNMLVKVNSSTGPGYLSFRLLIDAQVSVHSSEELATNNLDSKLKFDVKTIYDNRVDVLFSVVELENDPLLASEVVDVRRCRYLHEIPKEALHTYPVYSYGACKLARKTARSFQICECVHPARDLSYKELYCNYTGLNCLVKYEASKITLGPDNRDDDEHDCLPSCEESELTILHLSRKLDIEETGPGALVEVRMITLPTLRYKRNLIITKLSFVVSVGGVVGLFFSASILSIVEIFYLIIRKNN